MKPLLVLCLVALGFLSCSSPSPVAPKVVDGVIDLRQWDWGKDPWVDLSGHWFFSWKSFVPPDQVFLGAGTYRTVPLAWQTDNLPPPAPDHFGWATYAVRVRLPPNTPTLGLKLNFIGSAYDLYADGEKVYSCGTLGTDETSSIPNHSALVLELRPKTSELDLVFHVSDFHELTSGISNPILLGAYLPLVEKRQNKLYFDVFLFGILLMMGLYHMGLYFFHRTDRASLYFAFLCFLLCWRNFVYEEFFILQVFPQIDWLFSTRLGFWDYALCTLTFFFYIRHTFPRIRWKYFQEVVIGACLLYCGLVAFTPLIVFSSFLNLYHLMTLGIGAFTLTVLVAALIRREFGAGLFLAGFIVLLATVTNDILHTMFLWQNINLSAVGLLVFLLFQSVVMTRKFSLSIKANERLTAHLKNLNTSFERFVPKEILSYLQRDSIAEVQLGDNTEREMAVLFVDIRDFTSLSEKMTPQDNFRFINSFLSRVGPSIRDNGGFVDKYLGDGVMALFPGGADDAVAAALSVNDNLEAYNTERTKAGSQPIRVAIGIHCGFLMLGTIGENQRMDSTVISDTVNLASRMEGLAKKHDLNIVITEAAFHQLSSPEALHAAFVGEEQVKGKSERIRVWSVLGRRVSPEPGT